MSVNGITYKSTEHFLFSSKALTVGQYDEAKQIRESSTAAVAKRIGESIKWDVEVLGPWRPYAYNVLKLANRHKYEQNKELRDKLFETAPKLLVEASKNDRYWGAGLAKDDPMLSYPRKYRCKNTFGLLLTELRDTMLDEAADNDPEGRKRLMEASPAGASKFSK